MEKKKNEFNQDIDLFSISQLMRLSWESHKTCYITLQLKSLTMVTITLQLLLSVWVGWGITPPFHLMSTQSVFP